MIFHLVPIFQAHLSPTGSADSRKILQGDLQGLEYYYAEVSGSTTELPTLLLQQQTQRRFLGS